MSHDRINIHPHPSLLLPFHCKEMEAGVHLDGVEVPLMKHVAPSILDVAAVQDTYMVEHIFRCSDVCLKIA